MKKYVLLTTLLLSSGLATAECTKQEAIEAETTAAYLKSWQKLETHFEKYGHCDDGAIAEGYSESISFLMETKWNDFLNYKAEKSFFNFIIKHVDETWEINRYLKVVKLAKQHCSKSKEEICKVILKGRNNGL